MRRMAEVVVELFHYKMTLDETMYETIHVAGDAEQVLSVIQYFEG